MLVSFASVGHAGNERRREPGRCGGWNYGPVEKCLGRMRLLPRLTQGSRRSPWDMGILRQAGTFRPVGGGWGGDAVCGRGAAEGFRHGGITNGTVRIRSAWGKCGAGRQRSGNRSVAPNLEPANDMPPRNANGENSGQRRPKRRRKVGLSSTLPLETPARGHAADGISRFFATAPGVMSRSGILLGPRHRIAAMAAVRPCVRRETANVSGCGARRQRVDSSAAWNTRLRGPNAVMVMPLPPILRSGGRQRGLIRRPLRSFSMGAMATRR